MDTQLLYQHLHQCNADYHNNNQGLLLVDKWSAMLEGVHSIIEVGCGNGLLCNELVSRGKDVCGFDLVDGPYIRNFTFGLCDITTTPLPSGYDLALCFDVLEHLASDSIDKVLANIAQSASRFVLSIAGYGGEPTHLTVKTPGWWLNHILQATPGFAWYVEVFERHSDYDSPVYLFMGAGAGEGVDRG